MRCARGGKRHLATASVARRCRMSGSDSRRLTRRPKYLRAENFSTSPFAKFWINFEMLSRLEGIRDKIDHGGNTGARYIRIRPSCWLIPSKLQPTRLIAWAQLFRMTKIWVHLEHLVGDSFANRPIAFKHLIWSNKLQKQGSVYLNKVLLCVSVSDRQNSHCAYRLKGNSANVN